MCSVLPEIYRVKIDDDIVESFCGELNIIVCQHYVIIVTLTLCR